MGPESVVVMNANHDCAGLMKHLIILFYLAHPGQTTPPIKVTAKTADRLPLSIKKHTLTSETIKRKQYATLENAFNSLPGVIAVQSGNLGQPSSIFVRGANSNHLQVRLDGMRINSPDAANSTIDTGLISPTSLSTISIIRGGQGSLYGPDAIGGIIVLTTPKAINSEERLHFEAGSNRVATLKGNADHKISNTSMHLAAQGIRSSGIHQVPLDNRHPQGHYPRLYYRQNGINARLDHAINNTTDLMVVTRYSQADTLIQLRDKAAPQDRDLFLQRGQISFAASPDWNHRVGVGFFQSRQKNAIRNPLESRTVGQRSQLDWKQDYRLKSFGDVSFVLEGAQDRAVQQDQRSSMIFEQKSFGAGGLWQKKTTYIDMDLSIRRDQVTSFAPAVTHREGFALKPWSATQIRTSYATSFKTPTLYQLYAKTPYFTGNPNLRPEQSRQWEIGFDQIMTRNIKWEETYFINRLSRLIYPTRDFISNINLGKAQIKGLESGVSITERAWHISAHHTLMTAENSFDHSRLLRRPRTKISSHITYNYDDWLYGLEVTRIGHRPDLNPTTFQRQKAKPYLLVHAKIQHQTHSDFRVFGRIENLLNRKIQEPLGYRKTGLAVYLGMEKAFV